jgi:polyphosphate kinase 2 (PPK2 family)
VHPELLAPQAIDPARAADQAFWTERYEDIATWERHLTRSGTRVVKFFLHISKAEQRRRFLARAEEPEKQWKFSAGDVREHARYDDYQRAYDAMLRATSSKHEPWYVIPADHKWFLRTAVAAILVHHLEAMDPRYPKPSPEDLAAMEAAAEQLRAEA